MGCGEVMISEDFLKADGLTISPRTRNILFLCLLMLALLSRLYLLYTTQHYLDGDEAVVGLMAFNILEKGEHPLYWYGLHYAGGGSWEAHLGALMFALLGFSDVSLKYAALIISLLLLIMLYKWVSENFGEAASLAASFFYVFSVSFSTWNLKLRGHLTVLFCFVFLFWIFYRFLFQGKNNWRWAAGAGLAAGLSFWCLESTITITVLFLFFWFYYQRKILLTGNFWVFCAIFFLGIIPNIYENLSYNFANLRHLFIVAPGLGDRGILTKVVMTFTHDLPSVFHTDIVHHYPDKVEWWGWGGFIIVTAAVLYFLFKTGGNFILWVKGIFFPQKVPALNRDFGKYAFLIVFLLIYQFLFTFTTFSEASPRYILPVMPALFAVMALVAIKLLTYPKKAVRILVALAVLVWAAMGIKETIALSKDYRMIEAKFVADSRDLDTLIDFMQENHINTAYSNYFTQFRVMFYSNWTMTVSRTLNNDGAIMGSPGISLYPEAEKIVVQSSNPAFIFHTGTIADRLFQEYLTFKALDYRQEKNPSYTIYWDFQQNLGSGDFIEFLRNKRYNSLELYYEL